MTNDPRPTAVIEIFGEGVTDIGAGGDTPAPPVSGVFPVLVGRLCGDPPDLLVKRKALQHLIGKGIWQKVRFAKQQASYNPHSVGCVFVLDSEGDPATVTADLQRGRASCAPEFPMAVGVAHPCIEAWLLSDASAVRQGLSITGPRPVVPQFPEALPAPQQDRKNNPKTVLDALHPKRNAVNAADKTAIAEKLSIPDDLTDHVCPSFRAFADEVRIHIRDRLFPLPAEMIEAEPAEDTTDPTPQA